ncbi:TIGR03085 family metal-binding protein [Desertihabitans aurantiacus]|uniref:TIGR03085 family metal-binding protein n=1 Tax=Desertihabitans aurantiacus TaxID=2282477 RepID=UPI000DF74321|nr:TIGR03085 family metal-binding protein [Desertihabitans aurantiacus]
MHLAQSERAALCDLLDSVGPAAPTLCGSWTTHDLAAHLWVRETDPLGAPGIVARPLAGLTEKRMSETKERWEYAELVDKIRKGPARFSVFALPGVDEPANATEFLVHHEDVRRAGPDPAPPRDLGAETEDWVWRRLKLLGRAFFRRAPVGVVLERSDDGQASGDDRQLRVSSGADTVTLVGRPSELLLYGHGRGAVADLQVIGEDEPVRALTDADFSL